MSCITDCSALSLRTKPFKVHALHESVNVKMLQRYPYEINVNTHDIHMNTHDMHVNT